MLLDTYVSFFFSVLSIVILSVTVFCLYNRFNPFMHGVHDSGQIFGSNFEPFKLKYHALTSPKPCPQSHLIVFSVPLCHFEIGHTFKMAGG